MFWRKRGNQGNTSSYGKDKRAAHVSASYRKGFGMQHMTLSDKTAGVQKPGVCIWSHCCGSGACTGVLPALPSPPLSFPCPLFPSPHLFPSCSPSLRFSLRLLQSPMHSRLAKTHCIAKADLELFTLLLLRHELCIQHALPCLIWSWLFSKSKRTWRFLIHAVSFCVAWYLAG